MKTFPLEKNKPSLEDLFEDLLHPNPNINRSAFLGMRRYWPNASIDKLILNLNHKNVELRRKSVKALGSFGQIVVSPIVKMFLANQDITIRISCLKVLVQVAAIEKYNALPNDFIEVIELSLKEDNPIINLTVVSLLRQLGKVGLPFLMEVTRSENILIAKASVTALAEIEDPSAMECLKGLVGDSEIDQLIQESVYYSLES